MRTLTFAVLTFIYIPLCLYSQTMIIHTTDGQSQSIQINQIESITFSTSQAPTAGLVAYYPFNGNANDESGKGRNGKVDGANLTNDRFNRQNCAYNFDGINDKIDLNFNSKEFGNKITITTWFYSTKSTNRAYYQGIVSNHDRSDTGISILLSDHIQFYIQVSGGRIGRDLGSFNKNQWIFVAIVYDGTKVQAYKDGSLIINEPFSGNINGETLFDIGHDQWDNGDYRYFGGKIDEVRFYDRALSHEEIQLIYQDQN